MSQKKTSALAIAAGLAVIYVVWGSTYLAIHFVVQTLPPFLMAAARFLAGGSLLYLWRRGRGDPRPTRTEWRSAVVVGVCLLTGGNGSLVWTEQRVPSGLAALLVGTVPLWVVVLSSVRARGPRPGWSAWAGVVLGLAGMLLLVQGGRAGGGTGAVDPAGAFVITLGAVSWAIGSLYGSRTVQHSSGLMMTAMEMLAGGAGLLVLGTVTGDWGRLNLGGASPESWLGLVYLTVVGSGVGFTTYIWLLRVAPVTLVSTYAYVNPVVALVLGSLFAGESLTSRELVAAAVILGAVILTTTARRVGGQSSVASSQAPEGSPSSGDADAPEWNVLAEDSSQGEAVVRSEIG